MAQLVQELVYDAAARAPDAIAVCAAGVDHGYAALAARVRQAGAVLRGAGAGPGERVAVWLEPCLAAVEALFGAAAAGAVMVPLDPALRPQQAAAVLRDSGARVLVTSVARAAGLAGLLPGCALRTVFACGGAVPGQRLACWEDCMADVGAEAAIAGGVDTDVAALLYVPGEGGQPAGVVLSHSNLVAAAASTVRSLGLGPGDRVLAALSFSLDFGFNQLASAFAAGAAVLLAGPCPARALAALAVRERASVLAALPSAWAALARRDWSGAALRCAVSAGGAVPGATIEALRRALPHTRICLTYGLPEAFRATCLEPGQRPVAEGAIGKPVPYADVLVLRPDGRPCAPGEPGQLVQRGPLVALGYWNDPQRTARRFRPLPPRPGVAVAETALWTGDLVRSDREGALHLVRGADDTIRTCGHRVSPSAVEQVVYGTGLVEEAAAIGVAHPVLGQVIAVLATPRRGARLDSAILFGACRARLPGYMLPAMVDVRRAPLPRNPNGKIDRALLAGELAPLFAEATP